MNPCPFVLKDILRLVALSTYRWPLSDRISGLNDLNAYTILGNTYLRKAPIVFIQINF